jgi:hypothetical protein
MLMLASPGIDASVHRVAAQALKLGDQIASVLFATEVVLRVIAQGAIQGSNAFLADGWGWLDLFIAVTGMVQDFVAEGTLPNMSVVRVAKVLKPLRVITHIPQLRLIVVFVLRVVPVSARARPAAHTPRPCLQLPAPCPYLPAAWQASRTPCSCLACATPAASLEPQPLRQPARPTGVSHAAASCRAAVLT